ncbi:MAG: hypothetical protein ABIN35_03355 [candidate division WOR-3 bacterium]
MSPLNMLKKIFQKIHHKILFESFVDSLLVFCSFFTLLFIVHVFLNNIFPHENLFFIVGFLTVLLFSFKNFFINIFTIRKSIEIFNSLNRELKNVPLVVFENQNQTNSTFIEILKQEFEKIDFKGKNFFKENKRDKNLRFFFLSIIIFLSFVILNPYLVSNSFNLTQKQVVLKSKGYDIKVLSFNLGTISGNIFVESEKKFSRYRKDQDYGLDSYLFFKGPKVESNRLSFKLLKGFIIDSIVSNVKPPLYTSLRSYSLRGNFLDLVEFSSLNLKVFFNDKTEYIFELKSVVNDSVIKFKKGNIFDSVIVNVMKDKKPFVDIIIQEKNLQIKDEVDLPILCRDDFGNDSVYLVFKSGNDSSFQSYKISGKDTILIFRLNLESIKEKYQRIHFVLKDNNPFRRQIGISSEIELGQGGDVASFIDSTYLKSEFFNDVEKYSERVENILDELKTQKKEENLRQLKEELKNLSENFEKVKEEMKDISEYRLPDNLYKKMAELKSELEKIDKNILNNLFSLLEKDMKNISEDEKRKLIDKIQSESKNIEKDLSRLKEILKQLNKIFSLNKLNEELKKLLDFENKIVQEKNFEEQKKITEGIEELKKESLRDDNLEEYENDLIELSKLSRESEKEFSKTEKVKEKLADLKKKVEENIQKLSGKTQRYNKELVITTLLFIDELIDSTQNVQLISNLYQSIIDYTGEDIASPLNILLRTAKTITENSNGNFLPLKEQNVNIINFLLKDNPQGEGASSLERLAEEMSSMSKEQQYISEMLWEMFGKGEMKQDILNQLGKMEESLSEKMKRLGEQSFKDVGEAISTLADSLKDVANDLKQGKLDEEILKKQDRVLKRMLNISKSIYKKGIDEKRESFTGKDYEIPVKLIMPEDYGYKKYFQLKKKYQDVENFERKEWIPLIKLYLQEILNE